MSSTESSGAAPAEATATTPAPSAEFPTFGSTRGSGLARGKRPSSGPAATSTASAPSDYKPTSIEIVNAPREYTNPFAPAEAPAPVEASVPAPQASIPSEAAADLAAVTSAQVVEPTPVVDEEPAQLNILPPAEQKTAPAQTWESDGFSPTREHRSERPRREERPERRDEPAAEEEVDIASIPPQFLYVRPGVKYVPTPRNWGGAPRDRSRPSSEGAAPREESFRPAAPSAQVAAPAKSGGFLGWLKSLFGGTSAAQPVTAGADNDEHRREGGERRHRGGRNRNRSGGESEGTRQGGI
jgi:translation initiation factor IF-2